MAVRNIFKNEIDKISIEYFILLEKMWLFEMRVPLL